MERPKVGFIGLGLMGGAMSTVLLRNGVSLRVFDVAPKQISALVEKGARAASSPAEVAANVDILCTSLPNGKILRDVYLGSGGALAALAPGAVMVDFSTTEPAAIRELHLEASKKDVDVVDAPVSGGPGEILRQEIVTFIGASDRAFRKAEPVLQLISGGRLHRIGEVGTARVVKLVNNSISLGNVLISAEAFALGVKAGVDPQVLFDVLCEGGAQSRHLVKRFPFALKRDFVARFSTHMAVKDLGLALELSQEAGSPLPTTALVRQLYNVAVTKGWGNDDIVGILRLFEEWAGAEADTREPRVATK